MRMTQQLRVNDLRFGLLAGAFVIMPACSPAPSSGPSAQTTNAENTQMAPNEQVGVAASAPTLLAPQEVAPAQPMPSASSQPSATMPPARGVTIDPACLMSVAWFSERESADIALSGCRPTAQIGEPNDDGWLVFENEQGERVQTKSAATSLQTGAVTFDVIYYGGGTLSGKYQVIGTPNAAGILKVGQFKIVALS